jgi:hypothetical protein
MSVSSWRRPLVTLVALAIGVLPTACSDALTRRGETGAIGSSGASPAAIGVEMSASYLTIENRAGLPLLNLTVIVKSTSGVSFSKSIPRLEASAKRDLSLAEFRGNDGTTYSPQFHRAREVIVTATDLVGKKYDVTVPWK